MHVRENNVKDRGGIRINYVYLNSGVKASKGDRLLAHRAFNGGNEVVQTSTIGAKTF